MKQLILIPVLMLAACASRAPKKTIATATVPSRHASASALRTHEQLREYRFGRYVDPNDPFVMHEGHPFYRVETSAQWNLRPGSASPQSRRNSGTTPSVSLNDAIVAEVNKQRAATRAVTEQTATLNQRLGEMAQATAQTQELARQSLALKRDLTLLRERVESFDAQRRERRPPPAEQSPPRGDDKW